VKVCEAVAKHLEEIGLTHAFGVNGGANLWLLWAIYEKTKIKFIPTAHESGAAFAADAFARLRGLGCCVVTSGPGATNAITGIAASYYDSVPTLHITGQVASFRFGSKYGVRSYGFQETPIVKMVEPITKYAITIDDPSIAIAELDKCIWHAQHGRKGPVVYDLCDDVQRADCPGF
jgi:acetolactate synthase-1/2/3 large subunit